MADSAKGGKSAGKSDGRGGASGGAVRRRRLGRGLSSLIGSPVQVDVPSQTPSNGGVVGDAGSAGAVAGGGAGTGVDGGEVDGDRVLRVALERIRPSRFQPRRRFDSGALGELASSIRAAGVMQPVVVRRVDDTGGSGAAEYELVAGERRWRAAGLAGLDRVPAVLVELNDEQAAEWGLIENLQREELGPMERAWGFKSLMERFSLTQAQVAERVGLDRSTVANFLRLTELGERAQSLLDEGVLTVGHGKALLGAPAGEARERLAERASQGKWSVRRTEREASRLSGRNGGGGGGGGPGARVSGPELTDLERHLGEHLGTKVRLKTDSSGVRGRIVIEFYDLDHFDGLMDRMGFRVP